MIEIPLRDASSGLCDFCLEDICHSNRSWATHHADVASLRASTRQSCLFCCTLYDDLQGIDLQDLRWPLYRWNLRKLASTRESKQLVLLTFRPICSSTSSDVNLQIESLPDRVFHFYKETDLGRLPDLTDFDESTAGARTLSQIQKWIHTCNQDHDRCGRRRKLPDSVPERLLDITQIKSVPDDSAQIRLVLTKDEGIHEPYVTLSHRWGDNDEFLQLNEYTFQTFTTIGFEWSNPLLPKTFKDAILLARELGISYIWIDSLCIIQERTPHQTSSDDPTSETATQQESKLMHQYYTNSFCNISTADSGSGLPGLFRSRRNGYGSIRDSFIPPRLVADSNNLVFGQGTWRVVPDSLWDTQLLGNLLYTRAWVFQERMLSPRILHFSKNQVFWECSTMSACEGLPDGLPTLSNATAVKDRHWRTRLQLGFSLHQQPLAGEDDESMELLWKNAVREYTRCQLTEAGDKLIAIWSVAKLVKDALDEDYQAGLWSGNLEEQLAWRVVDYRQINGDPSVRINAHSTPTWSWASLHGMIEPCDRFRGSGPLERAYHVVNHSGRKITFQYETGRSRSEPMDLPTLHTFLDQDHHKSADAKRSTKAPIQGADQPPVFKDTRIAIRGHLCKGHLSFSTETGRWQLMPWPVDHPPEIFAYEAEEEYTGAEFDTTYRAFALSEVFPDLDPGPVQHKFPCWLIVLAYSRDPGPTATFSGVGLMLQMIKDAHFERIGAFHFNKITSDVMSHLTSLSDQSLRENPTRQGVIDHYAMGRQADDFWLV